MKLSSKLWCFFGVHEWKVLDKGPYTLTYDRGRSVKHGSWYDLQCQVCGQVKHRKLA